MGVFLVCSVSTDRARVPFVCSERMSTSMRSGDRGSSSMLMMSSSIKSLSSTAVVSSWQGTVEELVLGEVSDVE